MSNTKRKTTRPPRTSGFTLTEMLVSVAVLVLIVLAFNMVMSESRKLVSLGQATMRANDTAIAVVDVLRQDMRSVSQNGFMCITRNNDADVLLYTTSGTTYSLTGAEPGNGSITGIGLCEQDNITGNDAEMLWRASWVLNQGSYNRLVDQMPFDFSAVQQMTAQQIDDQLIGDDEGDGILGDSRLAPDELNSPPNSKEDVQILWKYLAPYVSDLDIAWADGTLSGGKLEWYHRDNPKGIDNETGSGDGYRVLWTLDDQNNWPTAIRFRFRINDPAIPEEVRGEDGGGFAYEIICPVGQ
jgi:prepilin-type N-terminal cleavage/methylation domain-containing protein